MSVENIASIIDLVHPTVSGLSIITSDQIWILFDREIDETTVENGGIFITGPDNDVWSGPDLQLYLDRTSTLGDEDEILQSPGFHGIVQGSWEFERYALDSLTEVDTEDTVGSGHLYRTKAIFTPTNRLQADTEYRVYVSGDESLSDDVELGISERTVYDYVASGSNTSTGTPTFDGGYIGTAEEDTYRIKITTGGQVGTARFTFVRDTDPDTTYGSFRTKESTILLSDGLTVSFSEGTYVEDDQWSVVVRDPYIFSGNTTWPFQTGTGAIQELPETVSTSVIGDPVETSTTDSDDVLTVSSTDPTTQTSNFYVNPAEYYDITIEFDKDIDDTTVISGVNYTIYSESVTGITSVSASGYLLSSPTVDGSTLTLTVLPNQILENNLITVTLDDSITATDGSVMSADYSFWFTTKYNPFYCSMRMVRMNIGSAITEIGDDTINLAIHLASIEAGGLTWNKDNFDSEYYQFIRTQWVCCRAAEILLPNAINGESNIRSKRVGDIEVSYNTKQNLDKLLAKIEACVARYEGALRTGGAQVQAPTFAVKGEYDYDKPPIGRGWVNIEDTPAANIKVRSNNTRRFRNSYLPYPKAWYKK